MLNFNKKEYRNLQEQVLKNMDDIESLEDLVERTNQVGIRVDGIVDTPEDLPSVPGEQLTYAVGTEAPYAIYTYVDSEEKWIYFGVFPLAGPQGATGPQGPQGIQGIQGPQGVQGPKGDTGAAGAQGPRGLKGEKGDTGARGPKGDTGEQGPRGLQGLQGEQGIQGKQGEPGYVGTFIPSASDVTKVGQAYVDSEGHLQVCTSLEPLTFSDAGSIKGPQGETGATGAQGEKGETGEQGPKGDTGAQGPQGPRGYKGLQGEQGPRGDVGPQGERGPQGPVGPKGDQGPQGPQGPRGYKGDRGPQGPQGPAGTGGTWGDIEGTLSNQIDLQAALNNKVSLSGNETISGVKKFVDRIQVSTQAKPALTFDLTNESTSNINTLHITSTLGSHTVEVNDRAVDIPNQGERGISIEPQSQWRTGKYTLGTSNNIWDNVYTTTISDGKNSIDIADIASKEDSAPIDNQTIITGLDGKMKTTVGGWLEKTTVPTGITFESFEGSKSELTYEDSLLHYWDSIIRAMNENKLAHGMHIEVQGRRLNYAKSADYPKIEVLDCEFISTSDNVKIFKFKIGFYTSTEATTPAGIQTEELSVWDSGYNQYVITDGYYSNFTTTVNPIIMGVIARGLLYHSIDPNYISLGKQLGLNSKNQISVTPPEVARPLSLVNNTMDDFQPYYLSLDYDKLSLLGLADNSLTTKLFKGKYLELSIDSSWITSAVWGEDVVWNKNIPNELLVTARNLKQLYDNDQTKSYYTKCKYYNSNDSVIIEQSQSTSITYINDSLKTTPQGNTFEYRYEILIGGYSASLLAFYDVNNNFVEADMNIYKPNVPDFSEAVKIALQSETIPFEYSHTVLPSELLPDTITKKLNLVGVNSIELKAFDATTSSGQWKLNFNGAAPGQTTPDYTSDWLWLGAAQNSNVGLYFRQDTNEIEVRGDLRPKTIIPDDDGSRNLGDPNYKWNNLYISGSINDGTNNTKVADIAALITYAKGQGWIQ